jgi:hypothetical protein
MAKAFTPSVRAAEYLKALEDNEQIQIVHSYEFVIRDCFDCICSEDGDGLRALVKKDDEFLYVSLVDSHPGSRDYQEYDPREPLLDHVEVHVLEDYKHLKKLIAAIASQPQHDADKYIAYDKNIEILTDDQLKLRKELKTFVDERAHAAKVALDERAKGMVSKHELHKQAKKAKLAAKMDKAKHSA